MVQKKLEFFFRISENGEITSSVNIDREVHGDKFEVDVLAVHSDNTISTTKVTLEDLFIQLIYLGNL